MSSLGSHKGSPLEGEGLLGEGCFLRRSVLLLEACLPVRKKRFQSIQHLPCETPVCGTRAARCPRLLGAALCLQCAACTAFTWVSSKIVTAISSRQTLLRSSYFTTPLAEGKREVGSCLSAILALRYYWLGVRQKSSSTRQQRAPNHIALQEPISSPCSSSALEGRTSSWSRQSSVPRPHLRPAELWGSCTKMARPPANLHVLLSSTSKAGFLAMRFLCFLRSSRSNSS
ncbi:uncharacterized protein LOC122162706 [Centrocercus urophasianus]|uniref:uncharacterized protein LOC122162706 n=1 Tax=Centrocercus urophasianus TaxID=9002 RepID=UPI001C6547A0|nr:uncharacterized protein LOC122162706 [Centrocercus urophasianus]XP_042679204.1 uncharacterized protein LOC122162706 [Centrocercus urophasianus]XP_042679206.1 uncharacterized protein LOC122162706 [Centrocercus urophasianus]XP_042679207.1 uncharacterized protein LOC122162706 [Centrocercus urophasianus]